MVVDHRLKSFRKGSLGANGGGRAKSAAELDSPARVSFSHKQNNDNETDVCEVDCGITEN